VHCGRHPRLQSARFQHDAIRRKRVERLQLRLPGQYQPQPRLHRRRVRFAGLCRSCGTAGAILRGHRCGQNLSARRHHPDGARERCQREPGSLIPGCRADRQPAGGNGHGHAEPDSDEFQNAYTDANAQQNGDADVYASTPDSFTHSVTGHPVCNSDADEHRDDHIDAEADLHVEPNLYRNSTPNAGHHPERDLDCAADCHAHANRTPDGNAHPYSEQNLEPDTNGASAADPVTNVDTYRFAYV
jgi:hypothetical protein